MHAESARLVAEAEVKAERLVAALRIFVAVALGLVFALEVAPNAADALATLRSQIVFAALALLAYFWIGVISFRIARSTRYRGWMSWLFAAIDVGFIVVNLRYGLVNIGVSANYIPGLTVAWLAPLVLAFGALRYSPYLQAFVTAGLVAGLGYVIVSAEAVPGSAEGAPPAALNVLFGAPPNAMRLTMFVLAGLVLIVAAGRARALLRRAVDETRRRAALNRYLPPQIADWLSNASLDEIQGGRRQEVAILFADIRGFTARVETLDPAELTRFVGEFRRCVTLAAEAHGGVIDKFVGDSAMVIFGVPEPTPRDAANALACARSVLDNLADWNARLRANGRAPVEVGIGIHWGEVFCGAVGDEARLEFTVLGDPVNVAARIEQETKPAGYPLLVSAELLGAAGIAPDEHAWTALPQRALRGHSGAVDLYGIKPAAQ